MCGCQVKRRLSKSEPSCHTSRRQQRPVILFANTLCVCVCAGTELRSLPTSLSLAQRPRGASQSNSLGPTSLGWASCEHLAQHGLQPQGYATWPIQVRASLGYSRGRPRSVTRDHRLGNFKQQECSAPQSRRLKIGNEGVGRPRPCRSLQWGRGPSRLFQLRGAPGSPWLHRLGATPPNLCLHPLWPPSLVSVVSSPIY